MPSECMQLRSFPIKDHLNGFEAVDGTCHSNWLLLQMVTLRAASYAEKNTYASSYWADKNFYALSLWCR